MDWTAETFIGRVLEPELEGERWWTNLAGEVRQKRPAARYLQDTLAAELAEIVEEFRTGSRRLFFFTTSGNSTIDGRAGRVGVEEKCADLSFGKIIDGAIHRGITWVLGNPQSIEAPEAVSLHVVTPGAVPIMDPILSDALWRVLAWLATLRIHVIYINGETGDNWRSQDGMPMPAWLATSPRQESVDRVPSVQQAVNQLNAIDLESGVRTDIFDNNLGCYEYEGLNGATLAYADWPHDHWQVIEIGLLLRGAGYDAVKVLYSGGRKLTVAGRGVERRIQAELKERFGVVLDWGVPV